MSSSTVAMLANPPQTARSGPVNADTFDKLPLADMQNGRWLYRYRICATVE
jgi:hypothetical protein